MEHCPGEAKRAAATAASGAVSPADIGSSASMRVWASSTLKALKARAASAKVTIFKQLWAQLAAVQRTHEDLVASDLVSQGLANGEKSRYCNIIPYDEHRVELEDGTYINASWVRFTQLPEQHFIITQGPMAPAYHGPDTRPDFWRLVSESKVSTVISLAKVEKGFTGCAKYWPEDAGSDHMYGSLHVTTHASTKVCPGLTWRDLTIEACAGESDHPVAHLYLESWPNYDVGSDIAACLQLIEICQRRLKEGSGSMLIHCSGGVGRSGTFLAALAASTAATRIPVLTSKPGNLFCSLVTQMRRQRHPWCVESFAQFTFGLRLFAEMIKRHE